jgi:hypothetical protein
MKSELSALGSLIMAYKLEPDDGNQAPAVMSADGRA